LGPPPGAAGLTLIEAVKAPGVPCHTVAPDGEARRDLARDGGPAREAPETWREPRMRYDLVLAMKNETVLEIQRTTRPAA